MQNIQISNSTVNIHVYPAPKKRGRPLEDLSGQTFGSLTVIERADNDKWGHAQWLCHCSLTGRITKVLSFNLKNGSTTSARTVAEAVSETKLKHGHNKSNEEMSRTYCSWHSMKSRCSNPNATSYEYYGGIGITVCDRWDDFSSFLEDMGERPEGTSIDRIDPYGNYEPDNCRWATPTEQNNNKRSRAV